MRIELIRCDICNAEHNPKYVLPRTWITLAQTKRWATSSLDTEERHFCGISCLLVWATAQGVAVEVREAEHTR